MIFMIMAINSKGFLGKDNKLLYHNPEDLKFFKRVTWGKTVVMGRKTFESMERKTLPGRTNIVLSRDYFKDYKDLETMLREEEKSQEIAIIGGSMIYSLCERIADVLVITSYEDETEGDIQYTIREDLFEKVFVSEKKLFETSNGNIPYKRELWLNKKYCGILNFIKEYFKKDMEVQNG